MFVPAALDAALDRREFGQSDRPEFVEAHAKITEAPGHYEENSLFAGSAGGGRTWSSIATMLQTCKMNSVDPNAWADDPRTNRQPLPNSDIEALMPWNFKPLG